MGTGTGAAGDIAISSRKCRYGSVDAAVRERKSEKEETQERVVGKHAEKPF
jgi:hypothetical protein